MTLRRLRRAVAMAFALVICMVRYWIAHLRGPMTLERRAMWLQQASRGVLASLGIRYNVEGEPPADGLVVANHLGYLDIVVFSAVMPCFFVAKAEVGRWPFFGRAARSGGTLFLDRASLSSANCVAEKIAERLRLPVPVLLFPEGTSTDGSRVQRFHSRLMEPATKNASPITAAAIRYHADAGPDGAIPERQICWFGTDGFLPHLWNVLGLPRISADIHFGRPKIYSDRRCAAEQTHAEIEGMRGAKAAVAQFVS